ncbi:hypothetical protein ACFCX4_09635 [Kitasatospora sp. NPDC056327]|uniref:hypothetical protein n=1 Tax=Kitasatospora sp. NPDC056327 TaxID=3345785 RepID=UPI0035E199FA
MTDQCTARRMPASVRRAVVCVWVHATLSGFSGLVLLAALGRDRNGELPLVHFVAMTSVLVGLLLGTCAGLASRRAGWTRNTVAVIEALSVASGVLLLATGSYAALAGIALGAFVLRAFLSADGRAWFSDQVDR